MATATAAHLIAAGGVATLGAAEVGREVARLGHGPLALAALLPARPYDTQWYCSVTAHNRRDGGPGRDN